MIAMSEARAGEKERGARHRLGHLLQTTYGSGCKGSCMACIGSKLPEFMKFLPSLVLTKNTEPCNINCANILAMRGGQNSL